MSVARRIWKIIAGLVTFAGLLLGLVDRRACATGAA